MNVHKLRGRFGKEYRLYRRATSMSLTGRHAPLKFTDTALTLQFIRQLNTPPNFWRTIAASDMSFSGPSLRTDDIERDICQLFISGRIKAIELEPAKPSLGKKQRTFQGPNNTQIELVPAAQLLTENREANHGTVDVHSALRLLESLTLSDEELITLAAHQGVPQERLAQVAPATAALAQQMASGDLIAVVSHQANQTQLPYTEEGPSGSSDASTDAAPNTETGGQPSAPDPAPAPAPVQEEVPECKLTKLTVSCSHDGRKQEVTAQTGTTLELDVVASESAKRGFEKIKATVSAASPCGSHTEASSTISPAPKKTEKGSLENTYHLACEPITNPFKNLWLASIEPTRYNIAAKACERFSPAAVNVNVYPKVAWSASVSYGLGSIESKSEATNTAGQPPVAYTTESKPAAFKGKVEYAYDEKKEDLAFAYKTEINQVLNKFDWLKNKVDSLLRKLSDADSPVQLDVTWPNFSLTYKAALEEDKTKPVVKSTHELVFSAAPLIGLKGTIDLFPILLKAARNHPAAAPIVVVLEAAMKGVGSDQSIASLQADISLKFSVGAAINLNFSAKGANGEGSTDVKAEQSLNMDFQLEGTVGAKGHVWIVKFEKSYKAGIKTGFVGKVVITRDDVGYYWYSRFLFNGLVVYFTKYEKLEKTVTNNADALADVLGKVPDEVEHSSVTEWTWIEPDPDEESASDTTTVPGTAQAQQNNRHYLIRF